MGLQLDEYDFLVGSLEWQWQGGHLCCHGGTAGHGWPCLDGVHPTHKCWCTTLHWPSSFTGATEATCPDLVKTIIICLEVLLGLLNFTDGLQLWKARLKTASWFPGYAGKQKSSPRPAAVKFSKHVKAPLHLTSSLFFGQLVGPQRAQCFCTTRWWHRISSMPPNERFKLHSFYFL